MKKYKFIIYFTFIILILGIICFYPYKNDKEIVTSNIEKENLPIALMVETDLDTNTYQKWQSDDWPGFGYIFNQEKSGCENGGALEYKQETQSVVMKTNISDKCYVYFDKVITLADYLIKYASKDELILHSGKGADDGNYRFAGGDYHVTQKALDKGYNTIYDVIPIILEDGTIKKNNYILGVNQNFCLNYQKDNKTTILNELLTQAINDNYIVKDEVNNYVCFGSSNSECPKENLYRIIGIYETINGKQIKLIKSMPATKEQLGENGSFGSSVGHEVTYIGDESYNKDIYYWDKEGASKQASWKDTSLNTINLNTNFVEYLSNLEDGKWITKIVDTDWKIGSAYYHYIQESDPKTAYDYELGINSSPLVDNKKIGLMYVSDYYYATLQKNWNFVGYNWLFEESIEVSTDYRGAIWDNWLWDGDSEWLITPRTEYTTGSAFHVAYHGPVHTPDVSVTRDAVRPCFYLNSGVTYLSGDGSEANPYRIV